MAKKTITVYESNGVSIQDLTAGLYLLNDENYCTSELRDLYVVVGEILADVDAAKAEVVDLDRKKILDNRFAPGPVGVDLSL